MMAALIAEIAFQNKTVVYDILFKAASETLRLIAAEPKHLRAVIGLVAVLHTWGHNLQHHQHLPCVVPGGSPLPMQLAGSVASPAFFAGEGAVPPGHLVGGMCETDYSGAGATWRSG